MAHPSQFNPLPLPRGWPHRVRSAVVQVISLARTSLALSQSWASESLNRELRRRAEGYRLQAETQLLREETRIKDARMEQLEAHRRPHYPSTERLAILDHFLAARDRIRGLSVATPFGRGSRLS